MFRDERRAAETPPVNVVPFPSAPPAEDAPTLTPVERSAFSELGEPAVGTAAQPRQGQAAADEIAAADRRRRAASPSRPPSQTQPSAEPAARTPAGDQRPILDRLPIGVLVYRLDKLIYANRAFLDWTGYDQLHALEEAGGLDACSSSRRTKEPGDATTARRR